MLDSKRQDWGANTSITPETIRQGIDMTIVEVIVEKRTSSKDHPNDLDQGKPETPP